MKRLLSIVCAAMLCCGVMAGAISCGKKEDPANTLYVELSNAGFGINWVDPLIEIFESEHPGVTVKKSYLTRKDEDMVGKVLSGTTHLDLLFPETDSVFGVINQTVTAGGVKYDSPFADLSDIYNTKIPGEDVTMKEKMDKSYLEKATVNFGGKETYFTAPWMQAPLGFAINNKVYRDLCATQNGSKFAKLPNTTDELFAFMDAILDPANNTGVTPFIHSVETSYLVHFYETWMAQYNGMANQRKWWSGEVVSGAKKGEKYVPELFEDKGLEYALKIFEKLLDTNKKYAHANSSLDFTQVQNIFLEGDKKILLMPTGAWLVREMEANYDKDEIDVRYIDMPVASVLGTKLGITDSELSSLIDYVRGGKTAEKPTFTSTLGISENEVIAAVSEAANMTPSVNMYNSIIPAYSSKIGLAKEFLQLMASDRGMEAMLKSCGSCTPYRYDITKSPVKDDIAEFSYSVNLIAEKGYSFFKHDKLFTANNLGLVNGVSGNLAGHFAVPQTSDYYMSAEDMIKISLNSAKAQWSTYLKKAGII